MCVTAKVLPMPAPPPPDDRLKNSPSTIRYAVETCSLGRILVAASAAGVCAVLLGDDRASLVDEMRRDFPDAQAADDDAALSARVARVLQVLEEPHRETDIALDIRGTPFQIRVWDALRRIAPGTTASYAEIARRIDAPKAVRAVAGACASNRIAVMIPCHRVVRSDGTASGFRWGVDRKHALLAREARS